MDFLKATPKDTREIYDLMITAQSLLTHKDWYCIDTLEYIREHIEDERQGMVFKAVKDRRIGAFFLIHYPGTSPENMGHFVNLEEPQLQKVAYMDSIAVLPCLRGRHLQYHLMAHGEAALASTSYCHLMGTVHPDNIYSLNNFLKLGYKIVATVCKYGTLPRHILYKTNDTLTLHTSPTTPHTQ